MSHISCSDVNTVCCSVLQCVAVCCSVLHCVALCCSGLNDTTCCTFYSRWRRCVSTRHVTHIIVCCSVLQCAVVCCSVLQCAAVCCSVLQCAAVCCSVLQCVAACCRVLQGVVVRCSVLQRVAVCCSMLQCAASLISYSNASIALCTYRYVYIHTHVSNCYSRWRCGILTSCVTHIIYSCEECMQRLLEVVGVAVYQHIACVCCSVLQCVAVCRHRGISTYSIEHCK